MLGLDADTIDVLTKLGWEYCSFDDGIALYRPEKETLMTSVVTLRQENDKYVVRGNLYAPSEDGLTIALSRTYSEHRDLHGAVHNLDLLVFGFMEAYLSKATNIPDISRLFKQYKIKESHQPTE